MAQFPNTTNADGIWTLKKIRRAILGDNWPILGFYPLTINQSLRFNDNDSAYLSRTPASSGNRKTWTWSGWVKRGNLGSRQHFLSADNDNNGDGNNALYFEWDADNKISCGHYLSPSWQWQIKTDAVYRDASAWYHIVFVLDTTQATSSNRISLWVNGEKITSFSTESYPSQNSDWSINNTVEQRLGRSSASNAFALDGYMSEVHFTDGTAYDATAFGEFKSGVWVAKTPSVTYGTNGFYLDFADSAAIGDDESGNANDWTPNNFTASDVVSDSPTNNFAVLNPLMGTTLTFSNGNLDVVGDGSNLSTTTGTIGFPSSGKYYCEITIGGVAAGSGVPIIGIASINTNTTGYLHPKQAAIRPVGANSNRPEWVIDGVDREYDQISTTPLAADDIIQVIYDADSGKVWFGINNTYYGVSSGSSTTVSASDIASGTNPAYVIDADYTYAPSVNAYSTTETVKANFGQQDFTYTPPTDYLALSTANLSVPAAIDPALSASPQDYFNTVLWTGDGTSSRSVTGVGFAPDFVWAKERSDTNSHQIADVVRGDNAVLLPNGTNAEGNPTTGFSGGGISTLDADGFTIAEGTVNNDNLNDNGETVVAWNWKANGTGVSNTDGTITSTVSANTDAGFSIITYTGNGTNGATVGHGLNSAPDFWITKNRSSGTADWLIKTSDMTSNQWLRFKTDATLTNLTNNTANASVITTGGDTVDNSSGQTFVTYAFHNVEGFSKFGSYTGNGSADGPFVYTGFRPAFILVKCTSNSGFHWLMQDNTRNAYNPVNTRLYANLTSEYSNADDNTDFLSNGFKVRGDGGDNINLSNATYIYIAFAENPFKYSNAR